MNKKQRGLSIAYQTVVWMMSLLMLGGCGGTSPAGATAVSGPGRTPKIAGGEKVSTAPEAPPYHFEPSSHAPIYRKTEAPVPSLSTYPALKMRFTQCFGREEPLPTPIATSPTLHSGNTIASGAVRKQRKPSTSVSAPSEKSSGRERKGRSRHDGKKESSAAESSLSAPAGSAAESSYEMEEAAADYDEMPQRIASDEPTPPSPQPEPSPIPDSDMGYEDWGQAIYLSNDDTMSLSSAQRILYAIDHFQPLPLEHIRPHELLNYFSFDTEEVQDGFDFSVTGDLIPDPKDQGIYSLALAVRGRPVDTVSRRNAVLTLVVDRSGSMSDEGRMDYLKRGLLRMVDELKTGDMVNLVVFDHEVCVPMQNFVVGRDARDKLEKTIRALKPRGATDLHEGLSQGYALADAGYRSDASNRVVLITDALTNTGVTDEQMISMISKYYDTRRIRLSGVGVGREFNDSLLDRLTERGKGAYVFLGSEAEVDAVFGSRFISLIETTALDVHFRLHLPPSLRMNVFYGEESSTVKEDVQEIHYFADTEQLFLSDLMARGRKLRPQDDVMLTVEYKDPETDAALTEEYAFNLKEILNRGTNARKGRFIMAWVDLLTEMAARPQQYYGRYAEGSWQDEAGWQRCEEGRRMLTDMSRDIATDGQVMRVMELFEKYCARFERPRHPVRRKIAAPEGSWPGAEAR